MPKLRDNVVGQIKTITTDLLVVKKKIVLLGDLHGLTPAQKSEIESLLRGLDGVRGWELGIVRQSFGLDQDLVRMRKGSLKSETAN